MKLILVRHGETEKNDEGVLTTKGIEQAKKVGKELKEKYKVDMVFCSPLGSCVETLNNILDEYPIEGEIFMSKLIEEMGVEPLIDFVKRVNLFLEDLKLEEAETVLVVSHRDPLIAMINKITGKEISKIDVKNAEIKEFDYNTEVE